jgi:hypothetical protein
MVALGPAVDVEGLEEVPHRSRGGQGVAEQGSQRHILAEHGEVLAAVPAARPERDETLDELGWRQPALALLDQDVGVDCRGDPELAEQSDHERHPRPAGDQAGINGVIDLERQLWRRPGHWAPSSHGCTHWAKLSKPDASRGTRLHGGVLGSLFDCSTS